MRDAMAFTKRPGGFVPAPRFVEAFSEKFADSATYWLSVEPARTEKSHNHEFAWVAEAWKTLPDHLTAEYPTSEHLRKRALIHTGHCDFTDFVCASRAEAVRWAANLRKAVSDYDMVVIRESVVRHYRAKSQSRRAMPAGEFQQSKTDILNWISDLLGVTPEQLSRAEAA